MLRILAICVLAGLGVSASETVPTIVDAARRGDHAAVRALLKAKADVNKPSADGTTALHWAVRGNDVELVSMLLAAGADARASNRYGVHPLNLAAENGSATAIDLLLKAGADPNMTSDAGEPVLMTAARSGHVDAVQRLIAAGANVNVREPWFGETAMIWAAADNHGDIVRALAAAGADVNVRSTTLDPPVLEFPRSGGPNAPFPRGGWTPLMYAARQGAIGAARTLIALKADLNAVALPETDVKLTPEDLTAFATGVGTSALVFAIINVHYDLAAMLLDAGADPNVADLAGMAALYAAVDMNSLQWVQGRPAPILNDRLDGIDLVKRLLAKGAHPSARLTAAPLKRHHDAGSTMNFGPGTTPLMRAARTNDVAVMRALLEAGADPNLTLPDGTSTLMIAAGQGYTGLRGEGIRIVVPTEAGAAAAVTLLLDRGVDVNAINSAGATALHAAVARGDAVVKTLAARGALLLPNNNGFTPLDVALGAGGRGGRSGVVREQTAALIRELYPDAVPSPRPQGEALPPPAGR
ncbi:MAG TPA: ankyrin repeat domain-containing protein [Vicinamibacterales bacterium]|nr:ankyrin repeat domain-containing protein [Vicinamibacterales bacterium]